MECQYSSKQEPSKLWKETVAFSIDPVVVKTYSVRWEAYVD